MVGRMITIYGSENCLHCLRAKQLVEVFQLEHEYKSVVHYREEFDRLFPGESAIPQIIWGKKRLTGYEEFAIMVNEYINNGENDNE